MKNKNNAIRLRHRKIKNRNSYIYLVGPKQKIRMMSYTIPRPNYIYVCSVDHSHIYYGYKYYEGQKCTRDKCPGHLVPQNMVNKAGVKIGLK